MIHRLIQSEWCFLFKLGSISLEHTHTEKKISHKKKTHKKLVLKNWYTIYFTFFTLVEKISGTKLQHQPHFTSFTIFFLSVLLLITSCLQCQFFRSSSNPPICFPFYKPCMHYHPYGFYLYTLCTVIFFLYQFLSKMAKIIICHPIRKGKKTILFSFYA